MTKSGGTVVLDSRGLSGWINGERNVLTLMGAAHDEDMDVIVSAMTVVEATHPKLDHRRVAWALSRLTVEPVTQASACAASRLLAESGQHGHTHAIDAVVAEMASRQQRPVAVLTSDPDDLRRLCEPHVKVVRV